MTEVKCACVCHDAYECYRYRYQMWGDDAQVRLEGGPCDCCCHDPGDEEDEE